MCQFVYPIKAALRENSYESRSGSRIIAPSPPRNPAKMYNQLRCSPPKGRGKLADLVEHKNDTLDDDLQKLRVVKKCEKDTKTRIKLLAVRKGPP